MNKYDPKSLLSFAEFCVSDYINGVSKLGLHKEIRYELHSFRKNLQNQFKNTINLIEKYQNTQDNSAILSSIEICKLYSKNIEEIILLQWNEEYQHIEREFLHDNLVVKMSGSLHGIRDFSSEKRVVKYFRGIDRNYGRIYSFVFRFLSTKYIFHKAVDILNISNIPDEKSQIKRSIHFEPEFKQSGIAILSYFNEIIRNKYPNIDVAVRIEQRGNLVTLIIETPEGNIEKIEKELSVYGLVVMGKKDIETYLPDQRQAMMLNHKLELAQLEAKQSRDLLYSEREQFGSRVISLEKQIEFPQQIFNKEQYENCQTAEALRALLTENGQQVNEALMKLITIIDTGVSEKSEEDVIQNLEIIKKNSPSVFDKINDILLKGAVQGTAGNYLYSWIQALNTLI